MQIYTLKENADGLLFYISDNDDGAGGGVIDVSALTNASADNTDRFIITQISWSVGPAGDIRLAWDQGAGAGTAGTTFITLNGDGAKQFPHLLTEATVEGAGGAGAGDLHITDTSGSFFMTIWCKKAEGWLGTPDFVGDEDPFGPHALDGPITAF